ncbi:MAG TPA: hypoxanthine-guanine phosphoribosyltransferase [Steroidobacteraceae bacterium]|nr:hypoxanthine-guanine phosphoribosyltransferase [Steroidobacteraceae bacterium]
MTTDIPRSEEVAGAAEVQAALERMAAAITARLAGRHPLVITVMNGGLVFAGQLLPRLPFALAISYVHVRRYGRETKGGELVWIAGPQESVTGRTVLLLDDILDEGETLLAIRARLYELGASEVLLAAFAVKIRKDLPKVMADFTGIRVPDRFVFGFGMDIGGAWRNLPSIRALSETAD